MPTLARRVWPALAVPEMDGTRVLRGASCAGVGAVGADWTAALALDATVCAPALLDAVIRIRIRSPTSALVSVYVEDVAPEMKVQFEPSAFSMPNRVSVSLPRKTRPKAGSSSVSTERSILTPSGIASLK